MTALGARRCVGVAPFRIYQWAVMFSLVCFPFSVFPLNYLVYVTVAFYRAVARGSCCLVTGV